MCEVEGYKIMENNEAQLLKRNVLKEAFTFHFYWNMTTEMSGLKTASFRCSLQNYSPTAFL